MRESVPRDERVPALDLAGDLGGEPPGDELGHPGGEHDAVDGANTVAPIGGRSLGQPLLGTLAGNGVAELGFLDGLHPTGEQEKARAALDVIGAVVLVHADRLSFVAPSS